jgi:hypothetical protein
MSDSKGKTPVTRPTAHAEAGESGDTFESVVFLEDANMLLEKVKSTAGNVTTCQVCVLSSAKRRVLGQAPSEPGR